MTKGELIRLLRKAEQSSEKAAEASARAAKAWKSLGLKLGEKTVDQAVNARRITMRDVERVKALSERADVLDGEATEAAVLANAAAREWESR